MGRCRQVVMLFLLDTALAHMCCVLGGAPFIARAHYTLAASALFVLCGLRAPRLLLRGEEGYPTPPANVWNEQVVLAISIWIGSVLAPLDWGVWWQEWPLPSVVAVVVARIFVVPLIRYVSGGTACKGHGKRSMSVE